MQHKTHYTKLNPFSPLDDNSEIVGGNVSLGYLDRRLTEDFRLLSRGGVEILRAYGWSEFMHKVHFYAMEKDAIVDHNS